MNAEGGTVILEGKTNQFFKYLARREERNDRRTEKSEATIISDTNTTNPSNITSNSKYLRDQGAFICFVKKQE